MVHVAVPAGDGDPLGQVDVVGVEAIGPIEDRDGIERDLALPLNPNPADLDSAANTGAFQVAPFGRIAERIRFSMWLLSCESAKRSARSFVGWMPPSKGSYWRA